MSRHKKAARQGGSIETNQLPKYSITFHSIIDAWLPEVSKCPPTPSTASMITKRRRALQ